MPKFLFDDPFNVRRDNKKNSYEGRDYESVDEKSLSSAMSRKTTKKKEFWE